MTAWERKGSELKLQVYCLYRGMSDTRVPWYVKFLVFLVIAYVISPIDIIPDFIPVLGLLDEIVLVPIALSLITRLIPAEIISEYQAETLEIKSNRLKVAGVVIVLLIWIILTVSGYMLWKKLL